MGSIGEISHLCRLCLVKEQVNIPIFEEQGDIRQIFLKICSCLPVKITKEDSLPKKICDGCSQKLDSFYQFWKESSNSEKQLLAWLNNSNFDVNTITNQAVLTNSNKSSDTLILKQEIVDINDSKNEGSSIDYLLQQQQLPYQQNFNRFSQQEANATVTSEVDLNDEPPPAKRKKRAAPTKKRAKSTSDSEEDDDLDAVEAKVEGGDSDDSDNENDNQDPDYIDDSSHLDDQPGPSGVTKNLEAPSRRISRKSRNITKLLENKGKNDLCDIKLEDLALEDLDDSILDNEQIKYCAECPKSFPNLRKLKKHMISHSVVRPYTCDICHKSFKRKYEVKTHQRVHNNPLIFQCNFCPKVLKSKGSFMIHRRRHLKQYVGKCEICNMGFVTNQEYQNHMGSKHGQSSHICEVCGRSCYDKAALQGHMARHAKDYEKNEFKCEFCDKNFLQDRYLKHHITRIHKNGGQKFVCDLCGKKVNSKRSLRDHLLIHEGLKPIQCKECGRGFALRTTLKLHMRTHTGARPHKCTECGKAFTQRGPLKIHMRYHTGERPYVCEICNDKFVSKGVLTMHMKKHTTI